MAAAVTAPSLHQLVVLGAARLLGQARQGVIPRQKADDRLAAAVGRGEGGGDAADALLHLKALLLQDLDEQGGGLYLLHGQLRVVPDGICHLRDQLVLFINGSQCRLFCVIHSQLLFL